MTDRALRLSFVVLGVVLAIAAIGQLVVADGNVPYHCRRYCWLQTLLEPVVGDRGVRIANALVWAALSGVAFLLAWRYRKRDQT